MAGEIKEMETIQQNSYPSSSNQISDDTSVEVHLYRRGRGPIAIFQSSLVGPGLNRLDVRSIMSQHGLRSLFAFKPPSERGFRIRFDLVKGQSVLHYKPGSVVFFDSEPKGSLIRPISIIFMGVAILFILIAVLMKEFPYQLNSKTLFGSFVPPWLLAFGVILYTRMRKKTRY
ncbi:hypothetical protein FCM35_KLT08550 [Carex littledalei]|uniref:Uncharacterized protein n=1 Tax=Carex littledalei TaxID=544730 RepID=A0A833QI45_9POAL|nr:hypothetical protein FCM35_KLT08550 [Carex littledalei]